MNRLRSKTAIFLVGVKNTGKSHLARKLARDLGLESMDTDERICDLYHAEHGTRIGVRDIFAVDGGQVFRRLEAIACRETARIVAPCIVATGGGICDNPDAVEVLRSGIVVGLEGDPEFLFNRIMKHGIPAFMSATTRAEAWAEFQDLHSRRQAFYRGISDVAVSITNRQEDEIAAEIRKGIEEHVNGGE